MSSIQANLLEREGHDHDGGLGEGTQRRLDGDLQMTHDDIAEIVSKAVEATLVRLGIDPEDHNELRADFSHLRRWRKSVEQASGYTFKVVVTTITAGMLGALWLGITTILHK